MNAKPATRWVFEVGDSCPTHVDTLVLDITPHRWVAQQLREATADGQGPRFILRDNDSKFGSAFDIVAKATGIEVLRTPIKAPRANAIVERFIGSVRRECLDHMLIFGERQLYRVI